MGMTEFPERPGALVKFLRLLRPGFNISMFHYRNMGGGEFSTHIFFFFLGGGG